MHTLMRKHNHGQMVLLYVVYHSPVVSSSWDVGDATANNFCCCSRMIGMQCVRVHCSLSSLRGPRFSVEIHWKLATNIIANHSVSFVSKKKKRTDWIPCTRQACIGMRSVNVDGRILSEKLLIFIFFSWSLRCDANAFNTVSKRQWRRQRPHVIHEF